jgi:hypothetical protein
MTGGYMGKVLNVDLGDGAMRNEEPDEKLQRDFIGGYGMGARMLFSRQPGGVDPLGPTNTLGFLTGPLTGTPALSGARYVVVGKSPLTGGWADANSGGYFGPHLKFAGYDGVLFSGASERPVYLHIDDGKATLKDATHLWGKDTFETEDILRGPIRCWGDHGLEKAQGGRRLRQGRGSSGLQRESQATEGEVPCQPGAYRRAVPKGRHPGDHGTFGPQRRLPGEELGGCRDR